MVVCIRVFRRTIIGVFCGTSSSSSRYCDGSFPGRLCDLDRSVPHLSHTGAQENYSRNIVIVEITTKYLPSCNSRVICLLRMLMHHENTPI